MKTSKLNFLTLVASTGLALAFLSGCTSNTGTTQSAKLYSEEELGLRKATIYNENKTLVKEFEFCKEPAGASKVYERSCENAPPMIPHDVEGMMDMSREINMCTSCHLPEVAEAAAATPMPKSHFFNMRTGEDLKGAMDEARYNCSQCHTPQANVTPLVDNRFRPEFRGEDAKNRSNLIDTLNEGVK